MDDSLYMQSLAYHLISRLYVGKAAIFFGGATVANGVHNRSGSELLFGFALVAGGLIVEKMRDYHLMKDIYRKGLEDLLGKEETED